MNRNWLLPTRMLFYCMAVLLLLSANINAIKVIKKGPCDLATDDIRCRYDCGPDRLQPMCISSICYCTDVGLGSCKTGNNNEGCIAICQSLGNSSKGCFTDECICE